MATPFEFPLSYIESMLPTAATAHETVTAPMPQDTTTIDSAAALKELLSSLESPTVPQPQQPRQYQRVLGALGDALGSMASVRAGGGPVPVGPFAANQRAQQAAYEKQRQEAATGMADTRNKVRIGAFEESLRAQREKEVAGIRNLQKQRAFQQKTFQTLDENRRPVSVPYNYNPNTGTLAPIPGYEEGFQKYVRPFLAQGIDTETGQAEFRMIDPFPDRPGGTSNAGTRGFEPMPPPGLATEAGGKAGVLSRFPQIMDVFQKAADDVGSSDSKLNQTWNWVQAQGARTSVGPIVAPESLVNYYRSVRSALFPIVKAGSGAVFPEAELRRWESRFPVPGVDTPDEAAHAWETLIQEIISDIKGKYGAVGRKPPKMSAGNEAGGTPAGETPEQVKARIKAKFGVTP